MARLIEIAEHAHGVARLVGGWRRLVARVKGAGDLRVVFREVGDGLAVGLAPKRATDTSPSR